MTVGSKGQFDAAISPQALKSWNETVIELLSSSSGPLLGRTLGQGMADLIPSDQWFIIFMRRNESPIMFDYFDSDTRKDRYVDGPYLLCPFYNAYLRRVRSGCYRLTEFVPVDPLQFARFTDYAHEVYGPNDELAHMYWIDDSTMSVVLLCRSIYNTKRPEYSNVDLQIFQSAAPVIERVVGNIWSTHISQFIGGSKDGASHHDRLAEFLEEFGRNALTDREVEIAQLMLKGFSARELSRLLGISEGTIRNHMRQIYTKLHVSSQIELCGLFVEELLRFKQGAVLEHDAAL